MHAEHSLFLFSIFPVFGLGVSRGCRGPEASVPADPIKIDAGNVSGKAISYSAGPLHIKSGFYKVAQKQT